VLEQAIMDLGIKGRRALVCASSKGLGRGCAEALAAEGVDLVLNARGSEALDETAATIRQAYGVEVTAVAADITSEAGQVEVLTAAGEVDMLVTNAGGPPPGLWSDWDRDDFIAAFDANLLTPIALIKALLPGMMDRGWGRIVNITSVAVKAPIPVLGLSNTARSGLTGYVAGVSRQVAGSGVTINNLLPGLHDTDRLAMLDKVDSAAQGISEEAARAARTASVPAGRFGTAEEFGSACAWLCSDKAGFVIGQNVLLDGGAYPGSM
jgi:3-oxoacyl-[acyl-carrier protein] reductase